MATKPTKDFNYAVTSGSKDGARKIILKGLMAFNDKAVPKARWKSVAVVLRDSKDRVLGGLSGHIGWGWMYIELFWLPEHLRRAGHGRKLMQLAEDEARRRGCVGMFLNTASFQAPDFYPKLGFRPYAVIDDFPPGHQNHFLVKRLLP